MFEIFEKNSSNRKSNHFNLTKFLYIKLKNQNYSKYTQNLSQKFLILYLHDPKKSSEKLKKTKDFFKIDNLPFPLD